MKNSIRELTIKDIINKFVKYYEHDALLPKSKDVLSDMEFESCRLIAASMVQVDNKNIFENMINRCGGYDAFVSKMCELSNESVKKEIYARIHNKMCIGDIDKMKLDYLSVEDTFNVLIEEKDSNQSRLDR